MTRKPDQYALVRHFVAALAYRTQKVLRGASPEFATFRVAPGVRTPHELVRHMSGVLNYALGLVTAPRPELEPLPNFWAEIERFHVCCGEVVVALAADLPGTRTTPERLLQGPLADAMTHAGQLALLRSLAGQPVPPENFHDALIDVRPTSAPTKRHRGART